MLTCSQLQSSQEERESLETDNKEVKVYTHILVHKHTLQKRTLLTEAHNETESLHTTYGHYASKVSLQTIYIHYTTVGGIFAPQ